MGWRRLRPLGFLLGVGMHFMIALLMENLIYFSVQMWTFYLLFIPSSFWQRLVSVRALNRQVPGG